jgi:hypothetical protein
MLLVPVISGTVADQFAVPPAVPEPPVELVHVTDVTSLDAVPAIAMLSADVETIVKPGVVILRLGGAAAGGGGAVGVVGELGVVGGEAGGAACRFTVVTLEATLPAPSTAVTVTMFNPRFSGTTAIVQTLDPLAVPEGPWLLVHVTCRLPVPPVTVPAIGMEDVVTLTDDDAGLVTCTASAGGGFGAAGLVA